MTPFARIAMLLVFVPPLAAQEQGPRPPVAAVKPHGFDFHGRRLEDPYSWLKDKRDPEVVKYLEAENAYSGAVTKRLKPFEDALYEEMLSHVKQTDRDVPIRENGYWYYSRTVEGKQYPIHCRKKGDLEAAEEVLLDVNELAEGQKFLSAHPVGISDDGQLYTYLTDTTGFREYQLSVKDLRTGKVLEDKFVKAAEAQWAGDNKTLFYVVEDDAKRAFKVFRHVIGHPVGKDALVAEEKDERYSLSVGRTRDRKYLIYSSTSSTTSEQWFLDAADPAGRFAPIAPRKEGVEYAVDHRDGRFHIRTNKDGAENFKWMTCPVAETEPKGWVDFEPYKPDVFTEGVALFKDFALISERAGGNPQVRTYDFATKASTRLDFPEPSYDVTLAENREFDTDAFRFNYTSLVTPASVFSYHVAKKERTLLKRTEVPGGFDAANYVTERIEATAPDGAKVPITLAYRKGLVKDGKAPVYLYAYGAYGYSADPGFSATRLSLLDRGVVYALAHVRGGSDLGRRWYLDGKMMKKVNTFTDFIACADHLVNEKYGSRDRLAIEGGSAGGLLIGAVLNLRPDLCKVAHLAVPYLDVINTMLDETLPLTGPEFLEWGNPKERAAGEYMLGYSPYDNLAKKAYPTILVTTSLNDSQVLFHEPAKYVAKLRALKTDANPLLLKCNMDAGHGGASGRYEAIREKAFGYAFMLDQLGIGK